MYADLIILQVWYAKPSCPFPGVFILLHINAIKSECVLKVSFLFFFIFFLSYSKKYETIRTVERGEKIIITSWG